MPTPQEIEQHRKWAARDRTGEHDREDIALCEVCGCAGNCECGHRPLGEPEHLCELAVNDPDGEDLRCYCCRIAGIEAAKAAGGKQ